MKMSTLLELRYEYRTQHQHMLSQKHSIKQTTRRQAACRPMGGVYRRLLMLEINKQSKNRLSRPSELEYYIN